MTKTASFDVFDTLLVRATGSPESNFLLFGQKFKSLSLIDCSAEEFARIRERAEQRAFANAGGFDSKVDLRQIYIEVGAALGLTEAEREQLIHWEYELEKQIIRSVPRAQELLQEARNRYEQIVFVSDMYLRTHEVKQLLVQHGLYTKGDRCYVSSDYAKTKGSGALFEEVLQRENLLPQQLCHYGNNAWSDVHQAKRLGLQVAPFPEGNLNRYEEIWESYTWATGGLSSAMAGASRLARLTIPAKTSKEAILRDVAAGVAAPTVIGFVLWILKRAQKIGLKRLYFVSRDGQMLCEIARRLIQKMNFSCDLRYIYGSRQAWLLPSLTQVDEQSLSRIFTGKLKLDVEFISAQIALARLNIQPEEIKDALATIGLVNRQDWHRNLNHPERDALYHLILNHKQVHEVVLEKAEQARQLMLDYLGQEGLLEPVRYGMVDVGTGATLHYGLANVLSTVGQKPPTSFYLGLWRDIPANHSTRPEAYFFDRHFNAGFFDRDTPGVNEMVELACSADHGTVTGYRRVGDRVDPVFKQHDNQPVMDWGFPIVRDTMLCVAENLLLDPILVNLSADLRPATVEAIAAFWLNPSPAEAEVWGAFPMEDGWGQESFYHCFAKAYQWKDLIPALLHGSEGSRRHWWYPGALAITPSSRRLLFKVCLKIGRKQKKLRGSLQLGTRTKRLMKRTKRLMKRYIPAVNT